MDGLVTLRIRRAQAFVACDVPVHPLGTRHLLPSHRCSNPKQAVVPRPHEMSSKPEEITNHPMHEQKPLRLTGRFEPSHVAFTLPCRLMRDLDQIICIAVCIVNDVGHHLALRRAIAST